MDSTEGTRTSEHLATQFYDRTSKRFWSPEHPVGRDLQILPLIPHGGTLLEYGFGSGSLLFSQVDHFTSVIGYDISPVVVENAESYRQTLPVEAAQKLKFYIAGSDGLCDLATGTVDVIVCVATIEHMFDPYDILDQFHRVLKPSGSLIVSVPNYGYIKHRLCLLFGQLPRTGTDDPVSMWRQCGWDGGHLHTFTKRAFSTLLLDTGWRPIRWTGWGRYIPSLRAQFPGLLSGEIIAVCQRGDPTHIG